MSLKDDSIAFIKTHRQLLIEQFASKSTYPAEELPLTIFMAGSPGAGKTEFSQELVSRNLKKNPPQLFVRIDADDIRKIIPGYTGSNAHEVQAAAAIGVERLFDSAQDNRQHAIVDATFANYKKSKSNVERALGRHRAVIIFYLYQEPETAWEFTQKREQAEGRRITKDLFIDAFLASRESVKMIADEFSDKIVVVLIKQNYKTLEYSVTHINSSNDVDKALDVSHTKQSLEEMLHDI